MNDPDFNDFTEFQRGKTYEIYNKTAVDKTFSVTGKSSGPDISHSIVSGDNFISPAVKTATNVTTVLSSLTYGTHYSDVKRFNATTQVWESYASSQFTQFEPGKGYNIIGLTTASFSYGNTQQTTTFVYDSTGSRIKKTSGSTTTVYLGKDYEVEGSTSTKHLFLGDRRISTKKYDGSTHTTEYIHGDHINSSNIITDSNGNQTSLLEFDPYGTTVTQTGSANPKHKFTGQEEDSTTHLYYAGARYIDPQIGRFITADPTVQHPTDPQDLNRYAYARNNPITFTDPTGLGWLSKLFAFVAAAIFVLATWGTGIAASTIFIGAIIAGAAGGLAGAAIEKSNLAKGAIQGAGIGAAVGGAAVAAGAGGAGAAGGAGGAGGSSPQIQVIQLADKPYPGFEITGVAEAIGTSGGSSTVKTILTNIVGTPLAYAASQPFNQVPISTGRPLDQKAYSSSLSLTSYSSGYVHHNQMHLHRIRAEAFRVSERFAVKQGLPSFRAGGHNNVGDAFRHQFVSGRLAQEYGELKAWVLSTVYEFLHPTEIREMLMDLRNNARGINLARTKPKSLEKVVEKNVESGNYAAY